MIAVIVVACNHLECTTAPCLRSIRDYTDTDYRVICVDNGSRDGTRAFLRSLSAEDPRIVPVFNSENTGWAKGVLKGLNHLTDRDRYICLLNSDTVVTPGWLAKMLACLRAHPGLTGVIPNEYPDLAGPIRRRLRKLCSLLEFVTPGAKREGLVPPRMMTPGTQPAPPTPPLKKILKMADRVERRFKGRSIPSAPSGFCVLTARRNLNSMYEYLQDFDRYRAGELSWRAFIREKGAACYVALDTYVFHARGGSGAYYRYDRKRSL